MFTGIIRHVGVVQEVSPTPAGIRLVIDAGPLAGGLAPGDSLCVGGACLTAADVKGTSAGFDLVRETLDRTTLGRLQVGSAVNLEPALALGGKLDGHLVQGHVDAVAVVRAIRTAGQHVVEFDAPRELTDQMVPKGSVALDGVSLTIAELTDGRFAVALVPTTLRRTTLGALRRSSRVNVEADLIGKYVRRYLSAAGAGLGPAGLTPEKLREHGFM